MKIGEVYTTEGENPRTSVVVWTNGPAYGSVPYTDQMKQAVHYLGNVVLFLWVGWYHAGRLLSRLKWELRYDQWGGVRGRGFWG